MDAVKQLDNDQLYCIRHSLAHIMAQAVLEIRPKAKLAFGPPVENGFYYDFDFGDTPVTPEDFPEVEERMRRIIKEKQKFEHFALSGEEAVRQLERRGESYKVEYCKELLAGGEKEIGFYRNGPFEDMCAGPHVEHTGEIPNNSFTLDSLAGAYWRGDENNTQLSRIYALAFLNKKELKAYLEKRELARQRDHRKLGKELSLYVIDDAVGSGLPLWLPNGTVLREELEAFAKEIEFKAGFKRVVTPHITKENLYLTSGHLPYYKDGMFPAMELDEGEGASEPYYLKPMNCPHHHRIFAAEPRSYRDLPLRLAEYGTCYRYEDSGSLAGLLRVRMLSMNDAHIYCTPEQLKDEFKAVLEMHRFYYEKFHLEDYWMRLSLHDSKNKNKYVDNESAWESSETIIREVLEGMGIRFEVGMGEAAFYGPKVDFQIKNVVGREETASTNQLDFAVPERFGLAYIGEDGKEHTPYCIHRAPLGTHERFIAFLIEHFGGAFPSWMAPLQVRIIPVADKFTEYAKKLEAELFNSMLRVDIDLGNDSFNKRIRKAVTHKIPNMLIIGGREVEDNTVTLRRYGVKQQVTMAFDSFKEDLLQRVKNRVMDNYSE